VTKSEINHYETIVEDPFVATTPVKESASPIFHSWIDADPEAAGSASKRSLRDDACEPFLVFKEEGTVLLSDIGGPTVDSTSKTLHEKDEKEKQKENSTPSNESLLGSVLCEPFLVFKEEGEMLLSDIGGPTCFSATEAGRTEDSASKTSPLDEKDEKENPKENNDGTLRDNVCKPFLVCKEEGEMLFSDLGSTLHTA
jgi:hypothetical protein